MNKTFVGKIINGMQLKQPVNGHDSLAAGMEVSVTWNGIKPSIVAPLIRPEPFHTSNSNIAKLFNKRIPNEKTLQKWNNEGVCKSVLGNKVEPDGHDQYGAPSWLLTFGLI